MLLQLVDIRCSYLHHYLKMPCIEAASPPYLHWPCKLNGCERRCSFIPKQACMHVMSWSAQKWKDVCFFISAVIWSERMAWSAGMQLWFLSEMIEALKIAPVEADHPDGYQLVHMDHSPVHAWMAGWSKRMIILQLWSYFRGLTYYSSFWHVSFIEEAWMMRDNCFIASTESAIELSWMLARPGNVSQMKLLQ